MSIAVLKFGGSSLSNAKKLINAAQIVKETLKKYKKVALIVSAQGDTTDDLIERAEKISTSPNPRELDALLACGEQQSAALVALALLEIDVQAVSLNAF
ncbi:MAG: aspartate kinase, partial [Oscillospiraceae bacterium]